MRWIKKFWFEIALGASGMLVVGLGLGGLLLGAHLGASEGRAQIGDFVGGTTTPILTALTFIGVLIGIALQRRELIATREELERSAEALEKQVSHLEKQQLSQSFFDLFQMYKSVVTEISLGSGEHRSSGKAALERFALFHFPSSFHAPRKWEIDELLSVHSQYNDNLGNYYRIIFRIFGFLSEMGPPGRLYADMFRAQLTATELYLLFFNCISEVGQPLERYAVEFELFDNMPVPDGQGFHNVVNCLDPRSFGNNAELLRLSDRVDQEEPSPRA